MGQDKALIKLEGQPLVKRSVRLLQNLAPRVIVVTNSAEVGLAAGVPAIADPVSGMGALAGITAALHYFDAPVLIVACDMPYLNGEFLSFLIQSWRPDDVALVPGAPERCEPFQAIYSQKLLPAFDSYLRLNERPPSLGQLLKQAGARYIPWKEVRAYDPQLKLFTNWDTPYDYRQKGDQRETREPCEDGTLPL
jgi:molybdopterin-guanine dinucleotide biosynthesis protein A